MSKLLQLGIYLDNEVISEGDIAAASVLVDIARRTGPTEPSDLAWVAMCLALRTSRDGHTCVDFNRIQEWGASLTADDHQYFPASSAPWLDALASVPLLVGTASERKAFILDGQRLYLGRSFSQEQAIASVLTRNSASNVNVLLGGPGTGKTTEVARRLIERFEQGGVMPRLALAAPTGKAATRMTEVLHARCKDQNASPEVVAAVTAVAARTIHSLLGYAPNRTPRFTFGAHNPLPYDLVVIDEASMLSSSDMYQLLEALAPTTELLLVGDPDQLASVESGSVLADIAASANNPQSLLASRIKVLQTQHRFAADSSIAALATAVRNGDTSSAFNVLEVNNTDLRWVDPKNSDLLQMLIDEVHLHALGLCESATNADAAEVLEKQRMLQVLCAHRGGEMGVFGWNDRINGLLGSKAATTWYAGRPVMVSRNNPALNLSNGDVGVVLGAKSGDRVHAVFGQSGQYNTIPTSRLEDVSTVHALTIHKSQGSEYVHAVVVLPENNSRILTRELLYTGVTRAIGKLTIVGTRSTIQSAIERPIRRASGLATRL